jgi:hypothetical protein
MIAPSNRPQPFLDPDPLSVEPEPVDPPMPAAVRGCVWLTLVVGCLLFWALVALVLASLLATSSSAVHVGAERLDVAPFEGRGFATEHDRLSGTPHVLGGIHSAREVRESAVGWHHYPNPVPGGVPQSDISTAIWSGSATWCAPTKTQCGGWGGDAHLGAVHSFRFGDMPYSVRVCRGSCTVVLVVSHCACGGSDAAIDLSPAAFAELAELSRGRITISVEGPLEEP